ncbi:MAG TPA: carboxypeptidase-like regulatory domain-containing protein [Candidatus Acidoferrales bacterium]|nr:carboxypeptidase-like regulatory domain-containing protein [Candidatus Acidoferrales bacterium]
MKSNRVNSGVLASVLLLGIALCPKAGLGQESPNRFILDGRCVRPDGMGIPNVQASAEGTTVSADKEGRFRLALQPGEHKLKISAPGFTSLHVTLPVTADSEVSFELQPSEQVTVHAEAETFSPDPSARVISRDDVVAANPGRPGVPISIPGYPAETASGGIKAPQYFAPGVASDHGVLIAQFVRIGDFLYPNNLSANAHGNGYADPNLLIPQTIGDVETDGAAFDVRYGDHAVDLSTTYGLRSQLGPSAETIFDSRNVDVVSIWSPQNPHLHGWIASEAAFGNGYLNFAEHRRQG